MALRYRISNEKSAIVYALKGLELAQRTDAPEAMVISLNAMGNAYNAPRKDSSFYFYSKAARMADSCKLDNMLSRIILNLGMIYIDASNFKSAAVFVDSSIMLAEKYQQSGVLADAFNAMGLIRIENLDSSGSKQSFEKAFEIAKKNNLSRQCGNALANLALFELNIDVSRELLTKALRYYQGGPGMEEEIATTSVNLGSRQINTDSAIIYYQTAINIAGPADLNGVVISACNNLAYAYLDKKEIAEAENCLKTAIPLAMKLKNSDWLATLYDSYADVLIEKGSLRDAIQYQKKAYKSRTISDNEKSRAQVRLLYMMFDLRAKDQVIRQKDENLQMKTTENLILKLIIALSFIAITALIFILLWFKQRTRLVKVQLQMSAASRIIELEEIEKRRLGFELHDHVGYLVRSIDRFVQEYPFSNPDEKEDIVEKISDLRSTIRRFSHHLNPVNIENERFPNLVVDLIKDVSTIAGIEVRFFIPENLPDLSEKQALHLIRIIQELLTNTSKHATGSKVILNISAADNTLIMIYHYDGPGFATTQTGNYGFGFQSIRERIRLIEGRSILTSEPGKGTKWEFEIPL